MMLANWRSLAYILCVRVDQLYWNAGFLAGSLGQLAPRARAIYDLLTLEAGWQMLRRDSTPDLGPPLPCQDLGVLATSDERADAYLNFLVNRAGPLQQAAERVLQARGAQVSAFSPDEHEMLDAAYQQIEDARVYRGAEPALAVLASAMTVWRSAPRFLSDPPGCEAAYGGAWAINLVLLTLPLPCGAPGIASRALLRADLPFDEAALVQSWCLALNAARTRVQTARERLSRIERILGCASANSRAPLVAGALSALGTLHRNTIGRGWGYSPAGVTHVMRQLRECGLADSSGRGAIRWREEGPLRPARGRSLASRHALMDGGAGR